MAVLVNPFILIVIEADGTASAYSIRRVDNGKGPITFRQWYFDDIMDRLIPEDNATRGYTYRLEAQDDRDALGRDDLMLGHIRRTEAPPRYL